MLVNHTNVKRLSRCITYIEVVKFTIRIEGVFTICIYSDQTLSRLANN